MLERTKKMLQDAVNKCKWCQNFNGTFICAGMSLTVSIRQKSESAVRCWSWLLSTGKKGTQMNKRIRKKRERLEAQCVRSYRQLKEIQRAQHQFTVICRQIGYRTASVENYWAKTLQFKRRISLRQDGDTE